MFQRFPFEDFASPGADNSKVKSYIIYSFCFRIILYNDINFTLAIIYS
jgi:hypothetical protein